MICDKMNLPIIGWAFRIHRVYLDSIVLWIEEEMGIEAFDQSLLKQLLVFHLQVSSSLGTWWAKYLRWESCEIVGTVIKSQYANFPRARRHIMGRDPWSLSCAANIRWLGPTLSSPAIIGSDLVAARGSWRPGRFIILLDGDKTSRLGPARRNGSMVRDLGIYLLISGDWMPILIVPVSFGSPCAVTVPVVSWGSSQPDTWGVAWAPTRGLSNILLPSVLFRKVAIK